MLTQVQYFEESVLETPDSFYPSIKGGKKRKNRNSKSRNVDNPSSTSLRLKEIFPMTNSQEKVYDSFEDGKTVVMHGTAGTGKTFISAYLAMSEQAAEPDMYREVIIIRSTVPSRDQGFLPGNEKEKAKVYEIPYAKIFSDLYGRADAYEILKKKGLIRFESTSYLRGTTFENAIILFDEFQNCTYAEFSTVLTRIGKNCRIILSGDYHQSDMRFEDEKKGMRDALNILKKIKDVDFVEFTISDIVRSGFVKQFLIAEEEYFRKH